jgi:hypothetical protein
MKKKDTGLDELLALLKRKPELIKEIVFDPDAITRLLRNKTARRLVRGVAPNAFLTYVAAPEDGYPIAQCLQRTLILCAKGTKAYVAGCGSGTQRAPPLVVCVGGTKCGSGTQR